MAESSRLRFVCDHIIASHHLGPTVVENLALCCVFCNLHKGSNVAGVDPEGGAVVPLFHPRHQVWVEHFRWDGAMIVGISPTGRATVVALEMNDPRQLIVRMALIADGKMRP